MAEVIGVVASAISIAGLFKACVEAFEVIKAAQKQELDFHKAVLKLQIEKCRLYTWGEAMGLTTAPSPAQPRPLDTFEFKSLVVEILSMLLRLFSDTSKLEDRYGCRAETEGTPSTRLAITSGETDHVGNLSACFSNFQLNSGEVDTSLKNKLKWLVQDRKKFPALVSEAKEFIDGLQEITKSISPAVLQTQAAAHRIQQISQPDTLQLVANVCETDHPAFSDAASVRLEIVSMAPTRRDEIERWKNDIEPSEDVVSEVELMTVTELKHRLLQYMSKESTRPTAADLSGVLSVQPIPQPTFESLELDILRYLGNLDPRSGRGVLGPSYTQTAAIAAALHDRLNQDILMELIDLSWVFKPSIPEDKESPQRTKPWDAGFMDGGADLTLLSREDQTSATTPTLPMSEPSLSDSHQKPYRVVSNPRYIKDYTDPDELGPSISDGKIRGIPKIATPTNSRRD